MATRVYLPNLQTIPVQAPPDSAWQYLTDRRWRPILLAHGSDSPTASNNVGAWTSGEKALAAQFVSPPMSAGIAFSPTVTMKGVVQALEVVATDNVTQLLAGLRVVSEDGGTVRATLLAVANYLGTTEFNTAYRNKRIFDGDALTGTYTTVKADRFCLELGFTDASGTTPNASLKLGTSGTDLLENETDTAAGVSWLEFSNTVTFLLEGARRCSLAMSGCGGTS